MNTLLKPNWRQIDAGIWSRHGGRGHVEICFATAGDYTPIYEIAVYDERGRSIAAEGPTVFRSLDEARRHAETHHLPALAKAA